MWGFFFQSTAKLYIIEGGMNLKKDVPFNFSKTVIPNTKPGLVSEKESKAARWAQLTLIQLKNNRKARDQSL